MKLKQVPGKGTRPMMDRAKEALFNIIGEDILDSGFLDLFSGTGSVGIEALSRGADYAVFVELHQSAIRVIRDNLRHTRLGERASVLRRSAFDIPRPGAETALSFHLHCPAAISKSVGIDSGGPGQKSALASFGYHCDCANRPARI